MSHRLTVEEVRALTMAQIKINPKAVEDNPNFWEEFEDSLKNIQEGRTEAFWEHDPVLGKSRIRIRAVVKQ
jgi:hypothetical protein